MKMSETLLVQRMTSGIILLVRTAFELSGMSGRLRIWIPTYYIIANEASVPLKLYDSTFLLKVSD